MNSTGLYVAYDCIVFVTFVSILLGTISVLNFMAQFECPVKKSKKKLVTLHKRLYISGRID